MRFPTKPKEHCILPRARGVFLGCRCPAREDLEVEPVDFVRTVPGQVQSVERVGDSVLKLKVSLRDRLKFQAGQVIHLVRPSDGLRRPFVVASLPDEPCLELHVKRHPQGMMSTCLAGAQDESVLVQGTVGDCFYMAEPQEPLLLIGSGVGAAAILGVLRAAVASNHAAPIHVLHCIDPNTGAYCAEEFERLTRASGDKVRFLQLTEDRHQEGGGFATAPFDKFPDLHNFRVFLAGDASLVRRWKRKAFSRGANLDKIHLSAFKRFSKLLR